MSYKQKKLVISSIFLLAAQFKFFDITFIRLYHYYTCKHSHLILLPILNTVKCNSNLKSNGAYQTTSQYGRSPSHQGHNYTAWMTIHFPTLARLHNNFIFMPFLLPSCPTLTFCLFAPSAGVVCISLASHPAAQKHKYLQSQTHRHTDIDTHTMQSPRWMRQCALSGVWHCPCLFIFITNKI